MNAAVHSGPGGDAGAGYDQRRAEARLPAEPFSVTDSFLLQVFARRLTHAASVGVPNHPLAIQRL